MRFASSTRRKGKRREGPRCAAAFTLLEMMVVLTLIAILTAMIIPEMKGTFEESLLRSTSREIINAVEFASSRAITMNQTLHLRFDAAGGRYEIEPLKDISGARGTLDKRISVRVQPMNEETTGSPTLESATGAVEAGASVAFNADGTADGALILLQDRAGFKLGLKINPITSRIAIVEAPHE